MMCVSLRFVLLSCAVTLALPLSAHARFSYFEVSTRQSADISAFYKWNNMVKRYDQQQQISDDQCGTVRFHPCSIKDWKGWVEQLRGKSAREQIREVNRRLNLSPYTEDSVNWGMPDYWETPHEFLEISGDCEDYAISKYYSLKQLGFSTDKMRIIILQDFNLGGVIHAVLGVYDRGEWLILDNQSTQVVPALSIYHYKPIYGINEDAWWSYQP